jgi:hypothetical protein
MEDFAMKPLAPLIAALSFACISAHAQDVEIKTCGYVITKPGNYALGGDLTCSIGITINSSDVTLKLGDHTLAADSSNPFGRAISVAPLGERLARVKIIGPGVLRGSTDAGVYLTRTDNSQVNQVTINGGGIRASISTDLTVSANTIGLASFGIYLNDCDQATVSGKHLLGIIGRC